MSKQGKRVHCYECNVVLTKETQTKDHIPPLCLFGEQDRNCNLITVPCCSACNGGHATEDEALLWLICDIRNRRQCPIETFQHAFATITKGNLRHYRAEIEALLSNAVPDAMSAPMKLPVNREAVLSRMTKGLLYKFYHARGFEGYRFRITEIDPEFRDSTLSQVHESYIKRIERGNGVFRADCLVDPTRPNVGLFCFQFFEGFIQCVFYRSAEADDGALLKHAPSIYSMFQDLR